MLGLTAAAAAGEMRIAGEIVPPRSATELVIAPDPKEATRPVTVELCQSRAQ